MTTSSLLRSAENEALSHVKLSGSVLDFGGGTRSEYRSVFGGAHTLTMVNFGPATDPAHYALGYCVTAKKSVRL